MFAVLVILEATALVTLFIEIRTGIAVTGWQGERPYVIRAEQPYHYWFVIVLHTAIALILLRSSLSFIGI